MTSWQVVGLVFGFVAYTAAWVWGGRPERLGAGVLLFVCLLSSMTYKWEVGGFYPAAMVQDGARFLIFGWLCFRSDRWWPIVITAALGLMVLLGITRLLDPAFSHFAMASGHVGLGYLIDLALLLGVWERRLAGEPPAGPAAWAKADRVTVARRNRRDDARRKEAAPVHAAGDDPDQASKKGRPLRSGPSIVQPANGFVRRQPPPEGRPGSSDGPRAA